MNDPLLVLAVGLPALSLFVVLLGYVAYRGMIHYRMRDEAYQRQAGLESGDFDAGVLDLPWIEENIASPGGYTLRAHALETADAGGERKLAVFHHGIGWGWLGMIRYMELFRAEGWTVVAYDSRGHGGSGGRALGPGAPRPSYGFHEKDDLKAVADWAFAKFDGEHSAGLRPGRAARARYPGGRAAGGGSARFVAFGESMGAAAVLQYAALDPRLDGVIADCPFSSAMDELDYRLKSAMVPPGVRGLVALVADAFCRRLEGFSLRDADPSRAILETELPMLFIHGLEDRYVPWRMSVVMAETRRRRLPDAVTELLLVPGAKHAQSIRADRERYAETLRDFLDQVLAR
jgi:pimeloyl-ACP methyl ester carboxylesterase